MGIALNKQLVTFHRTKRKGFVMTFSEICSVIGIAGTIEVIVFFLGFLLVKSAIKRLAEKSVENAFEKNLEKYKDSLSRAFQVHNHVLNRQMELFDQLNKQLADLIPLVQDMAFAVKNSEFSEYQKKCFLDFFELIKKMKHSILEYEPYISQEIFQGFQTLVVQMQASAEKWAKWAKLLSSKTPIGTQDVELAVAYSNRLLEMTAGVRYQMIDYLRKASETPRRY